MRPGECLKQAERRKGVGNRELEALLPARVVDGAGARLVQPLLPANRLRPRLLVLVFKRRINRRLRRADDGADVQLVAGELVGGCRAFGRGEDQADVVGILLGGAGAFAFFVEPGR